MNKKGFVLTETLAVTVFLVTIFTFIYAAVIPLVGKYRDMANRKENIDIVYKLYHIRKMLKHDENEETFTSENVKRITCNDLNKKSYCNTLMNYLDLSNFELVYTKSINANKNNAIINSEMREYLNEYQDENETVLILLDKESHTIVHLKYAND